VEADETYIGGKARNMHAAKRKRLNVKRGRSIAGKVAVMALLDRHGKDGLSQVRTRVLDNLRQRHVQSHIREHVAPGATLHTDTFSSYVGLNADYTHQVINHAEKYVDGEVHTNKCENFWSLLKRAIKGTYVSVEPFHLFRYLDEQAFRYNQRGGDDAFRFVAALKGIINKRLTYKVLTGSGLPETC
jgi:transposase-like protein